MTAIVPIGLCLFAGVTLYAGMIRPALIRAGWIL